MSQILIVYASDHGGTAKMAQAIAAGVDSVEGCQAALKEAGEAEAEDVIAAGALVVGTPVHMSSMDWRVKKFIDSVCGGLWMADQVVGKVGAVFACGSGYGGGGGGAELAMLSLLGNLAELGLVICPLPKSSPGYAQGGLHWGPYGRAHNDDLSPTEGGLPSERVEVARFHGVHVARLAKLLQGRRIFA